jgi:hypothetical protein
MTSLLQAALARLVVPTPPWAPECGFCSLCALVALRYARQQSCHLAVYVVAVWALSVGVAAIQEEAPEGAVALVRQAFARLFSGLA